MMWNSHLVRVGRTLNNYKVNDLPRQVWKEDGAFHHLDEEDEAFHHLDEDDVGHFPRQLGRPALLAVLKAYISRDRLLYTFSAKKA